MPPLASPELPRLLLHGLDTLTIGLYFGTGTSSLDFDRLAELKAAAASSRQRFAETTMGGERLAVMPHGGKPYGYILRNDAMELRLAERMQPSCLVRFSAEGLWSDGAPALRERVMAWARNLGFEEIRPETIARADIAFDYDVPTPDFTADHFLTRAVKNATHRANAAIQTIQFGKGEVVYRVYDKVAEIEEASGKAFFYDHWQQRQGVWRIEAQVRGGRLKQAGIRTYADLDSHLGDLLRELATRHITLRQPSTDSNRARWPMHPLWQAYQRDIALMPQHGLVRAIDPARQLEWRLHQQVRSLYGMLRGVGALLSLQQAQPSPMTLQETLRALPAKLATHHSDQEWHDAIEERIAAYELGQWR